MYLKLLFKCVVDCGLLFLDTHLEITGKNNIGTICQKKSNFSPYVKKCLSGQYSGYGNIVIGIVDVKLFNLIMMPNGSLASLSIAMITFSR